MTDASAATIVTEVQRRLAGRTTPFVLRMRPPSSFDLIITTDRLLRFVK